VVMDLLWCDVGPNLDACRSIRVELWAREERIWSWDSGRSVWFVLTLYMATFRRSRSASAFYILLALSCHMTRMLDDTHTSLASSWETTRGAPNEAIVRTGRGRGARSSGSVIFVICESRRSES
jgi:hypothetical protein